MYNFKSTGRTVDIQDPRKFSKLTGDEFSELLFEDKNYISWAVKANFAKLEAFDIATIISASPSLFPHFLPIINTPDFLSAYDVDYIVKKQPSLSFLFNKTLQ